MSDGVGLCLEINDDLMALEVNQDFLHRQMVKLGASNLNIKPRNIVINKETPKTTESMPKPKLVRSNRVPIFFA